jgi:hypothetical protein
MYHQLTLSVQVTEDEKKKSISCRAMLQPIQLNISMTALAEVFGERMISPGLWNAHSPDLNPCDFHLWDTQKDKA